MNYNKQLESLKANLFLLGEGDSVIAINELQKQNIKMREALKEMLIAFRLKGNINEERKQEAFLKTESLLKEIES